MKLKLLAGLALLPLLFAGCAQAPNPSPSPSEGPVGLQIAVSTSVWGDIAETIGGDKVQVQAIISGVNQDPHSYEASARDQLAVNGADLVIANGGGYDDFMLTLAKAANKEIFLAYQSEAVEVSEDDHHRNHANEHIWYDFHLVADFANRLAGKLSSLSPNDSTYFSDNLVSFLDQIEILEDQSGKIAGANSAITFLATEPVGDYLLESLDFENKTPKDFSSAIEEERELSPKVLLDVENLINTGKLRILALNPQTTSKQIEELVALAKSKNVKIIELSELMPENTHFFDWMSDNLTQIELALR
ncbi:MAG: metal ABC transporter solute-binding protein, Zn/Mn family [Actinomycetota bacterium]